MGYDCLTEERKEFVVNVVGPVESGDERMLWLRNHNFLPWGKTVENHKEPGPLSTPLNRRIARSQAGVGGGGERPEKNRACPHPVHRSQQHNPHVHVSGKARVVRGCGQVARAGYEVAWADPRPVRETVSAWTAS